MNERDPELENGDNPPSGIYELKSTPSKGKRFFQRKSDNVVIGINLATILSVLYASHSYITAMEKRVTTAEVLLTITELKLNQILNRVEQHIEKDTLPCP